MGHHCDCGSYENNKEWSDCANFHVELVHCKVKVSCWVLTFQAEASFYIPLVLDLFVGCLNGQEAILRLLSKVLAQVLGFVRMKLHH